MRPKQSASLETTKEQKTKKRKPGWSKSSKPATETRPQMRFAISSTSASSSITERGDFLSPPPTNTEITEDSEGFNRESVCLRKLTNGCFKGASPSFNTFVSGCITPLLCVDASLFEGGVFIPVDLINFYLFCKF